MKKSFGLLALSLPAAFVVGCNLDTGIKVTWTINGAPVTTSSCGTYLIRIAGTSTSGALPRETCGSTTGTSCIAGSQVIWCTAGTATILNWASGTWNITVSLIAATDTYGATPVASATLSGKTVTEGQVNDVGTAALTPGGVVATTATIAFTFDTSVTQCAAANLGTYATDTSRCLRYKLTCGGVEVKKNTVDKADQQAMCAASTTSAVASFTPSATGSCTLDAQVISTATGQDCYDNIGTEGHCAMWGTASVTINASTSNALSVDLTAGTGTCPLTKQLW